MIIPFQSHERLLADIEAARECPHQAHIWWLGQSGFLVQWQGNHLLLDPYLSDSLTKKYVSTDKPHVRMTELVINPSQLTFIDVVVSTHNHTDHLDGETLSALLHANPEMAVLVPSANRDFAAERLAVPPDRLDVVDAGESLTVATRGSRVGAPAVDQTTREPRVATVEFTIHGVPAAHETIERDDQGRCRYLGYVVEFGGMTLYHSGDTVRYDGMAELLRNWNVDIAMLPINGRLPERRVAGNLWGREAAQLARDAGIGLVIPCHYELFEFNTVTPDEFITTCSQLGQPYQLLRAGERYSFSPR